MEMIEYIFTRPFSSLHQIKRLFQNFCEKEKNMKRLVLLSIFSLFVFAVCGLAIAQDDIKKHPSCKYCGMDRQKFAHSRFFVENEDGSTEGTCSIHCAAIDFALNIDKTPKLMQVGDFNTKTLIDAEKAFWVIGGNKPGVMTKRAKWAFATKEGAEKFMAENGGNPATFEQSFKASYEDMYADTKMIQERRKMRRMQEKKH
jgi:nitrous oxide reductase accessory protein NosL